MTHLPMARASMDVVATTSLVLGFRNTCNHEQQPCVSHSYCIKKDTNHKGLMLCLE